MDGLFPLATVNKIFLSTPQLGPLFSKYLQNRLTGVLQVDFAPENRLFFLFVQGTAINTYLLTPESRIKISIDEAGPLLGKTRGEASLLNLPLEGIRISKLLLESPQRGGAFQLQTRDLIQRIDGWSNSATAIAIQIKWANAEAVMVFPGHDAPVQPMIFVKEGQIATELNALSAITSWNEPTCSVSILPQREDVDAWKEYQLHLTFSKTAELVITHYNELAGRSLVSVLNQDIYDETLKRGWRISCIGNGILDHHIFPSPTAAAEAYRQLFNLILAHMRTVVGRNISSTIVDEAVEALDKNSQEIIRNYDLMTPFDDDGVSDGRQA
jgi:hypothetical protein